MFTWLSMLRAWPAAAARQRMLAATAPPRAMRVRGALRLAGSPDLRRLPETLYCDSLDVAGCPLLELLPRRLNCRSVAMRAIPAERLPSRHWRVAEVDLRRCFRLRAIEPFACHRLLMRDCRSLKELPEGIEAHWVDLGNCQRLTSLPESLAASAEDLDVSNCTALERLPEGFARLVTLNLQGCAKVTELPEGLRVRGAIEVADSGLTALPWSLRSTRLFWRGVHVPSDVAFHPESITVGEILAEKNAELRRVLLERIGLERFLSEAQPEELNVDHDAGGERRLLRIRLLDGEDLVCVSVRCPSTGNHHLLRVPPHMRTCRQAIAWTAGFDNPDHYEPLQET